MANSVELRVAGLHNLQAELERFQPTHVVSLVNPDLPDADFMPWINGVQHLVRRFYDVHREADYRVSQEEEGPTKAHVVAIIDFIREALASDPPVRLAHPLPCRRQPQYCGNLYRARATRWPGP